MSQKQQKIKTLLIKPLVFSSTEKINTTSLFKNSLDPKVCALPVEVSIQDSPLLRYLQQKLKLFFHR